MCTAKPSHSDARLAASPQLMRLWLVGLLIFSLTACEGTGGKADPTGDLDDFDVLVPTSAQFADRVVSLNPAFTEILFAIGAGDQLVGRTEWDTKPAAALAVSNVGVGIRPNVEAVLAARPTLVFMYATGENQLAADAIRRAGVHVVALRTNTISDFRRAAEVLGVAVGRSTEARVLVDSISRTLDAVREGVRGVVRPRVAWVSWESPVLVVANASYEAELLDIAGATNVFDDRDESVANVTLEEIARRNPERLMLSPAARDRLLNSPAWRAVRAIRDSQIVVLDTAVVGRPGVTMGMAAVSLARALHPTRAATLP